MATRRVKRTTRKRSSARFIVVSGRGNTVYVALVRAITDAALARAVGRAKTRSGVAKASRAFILKGKTQAERFIGARFSKFGH
jgi:hypothetical protein